MLWLIRTHNICARFSIRKIRPLECRHNNLVSDQISIVATVKGDPVKKEVVFGRYKEKAHRLVVNYIQ